MLINFFGFLDKIGIIFKNFIYYFFLCLCSCEYIHLKFSKASFFFIQHYTKMFYNLFRFLLKKHQSIYR